jgi:hypothetical protein
MTFASEETSKCARFVFLPALFHQLDRQSLVRLEKQIYQFLTIHVYLLKYETQTNVALRRWI